jgi:DNA-binding winged helix-turn-helix (wHTH) protein/TolB-like protein
MDAATIKSPAVVDLATEKPFRVGRATVDPLSREACFERGEERLQPQNLKVLIALARQRGKVVSREQLIDLCWDGRFVGDDVVNRAISTLRQFAERAGGFSIETVPRAGYRLVEEPGRTRLGGRTWALAAVAAGLAAILFVWLMGSRSTSPTGVPPPTIAILPFHSASADPAAIELAAAAHDALAHTLSQTEFPIRLVDVPPRSGTSGVGLLLSGSAEIDSAKARVTVRIVDSANQIVVYSRRFEGGRNDAAALADQVGGQVAGSLSWTVSSIALDRHRTDPAILAELFREVGNYSSDLGALPDYAALRRLAVKAPNSPIVQGSLAINSAFVLADLPHDQRPATLALGRHASDRVVALAPESGGSYISWCLLHSRARLVECEDRLRTGMRVDPDSPWADFFLAGWLKNTGHFEEALSLARHSLAHDQYAPAKIALAMRLFEANGDSASADRLFRQGRRWWPHDLAMFWDRLYGMADRGDLEAISRFADESGRAQSITGHDLVQELPAAIRKRSLDGVRSMCPPTMQAGPRRDFCFLALIQLGDNDDAFAIAERSFPDRVGRNAADQERIFLDSPWVPDTDIITGPATASLRRDPRYFELARRTGLLAYWRSGRLPDFCKPPQPEPICGQLRPR